MCIESKFYVKMTTQCGGSHAITASQAQQIHDLQMLCMHKWNDHHIQAAFIHVDYLKGVTTNG